MRAAVLYGKEDVRIEEVPMPQINSDQMLVRVKACGVCPSDIRVYMGESVWVELPSIGISGHEISGVVEVVGENVHDIKVGDRVAGTLGRPCGMCKYCITGRDNLCSNLNRYKVKYWGYSEYVAAYPEKMMKFNGDISFEEAAFTEPLAACVNGIRRMGIKPGDYVGIIGVGQMGLMLTQLARLLGAEVIAFDLLDERLKMAEKLGADHVVNVAEADPIREALSVSGGEGLNHVIVAIGGREPIELGLKMLGKAGTLNIFASTHPQAEIHLDPNIVHYRELVITGSFSGTRNDLRTAIRLIERRRIDVKSLITHRLPLEKVVEGFKIHIERRGLKVVIMP
ncbi:MAG: alcohol dehydrogenase catalytic domain-containing protein [Thermofilum sp.]|nr:alcohol dehydrogenase catalytic domain-containing protein [Thermofilum sp.]